MKEVKKVKEGGKGGKRSKGRRSRREVEEEGKGEREGCSLSPTLRSCSHDDHVSENRKRR